MLLSMKKGRETKQYNDDKGSHKTMGCNKIRVSKRVG